jgi:pimeloyl-ACP methyl ester carboxylesterase
MQNLLVEQLSDLLTYLGYIRPGYDDIPPKKEGDIRMARFTLSLIGFDTGAAVAAYFTEVYPYYIDNLILLSPRGLDNNDSCFVHCLCCVTCPCLITQRKVIHSQAKLLSYQDLPHFHAFHQRIEEEVLWQMVNTPGHFEAHRSALIHFPFTGLERTYEHVDTDDRGILIIGGEDDQITPIDKLDLYEKHMPNASVVQVVNAGHHIVFEAFETVSHEIETFLMDRELHDLNPQQAKTLRQLRREATRLRDLRGGVDQTLLQLQESLDDVVADIEEKRFMFDPLYDEELARQRHVEQQRAEAAEARRQEKRLERARRKQLERSETLRKLEERRKTQQAMQAKLRQEAEERRKQKAAAH